MNQLLPYRTPLLLLALTLVLGILVARTASTTVQQGKQYQALSARIDTLHASDTLLMSQQIKLKRLALAARQIGSKKPEISTHLPFGTYLDELCREKKITIVSLPQASTEWTGAFAVSAERFRLSGGFHEILAVLYQMEYLDQIGSIGYTRMETQTLRQGRDKQTILIADIELKRLEKKASQAQVGAGAGTAMNHLLAQP